MKMNEVYIIEWIKDLSWWKGISLDVLDNGDKYETKLLNKNDTLSNLWEKRVLQVFTPGISLYVAFCFSGVALFPHY